MAVIGCTVSQGLILGLTGSAGGVYAGTQFALNGPGANPSNGIIPNVAGGMACSFNNGNALEGFGTTTMPSGQWNAWTAQNNPAANPNALMATGAIFVITP